MKQRSFKNEQRVKAPLLSKKRESAQISGGITDNDRYMTSLFSGLDLSGQEAHHPWFEDVLCANVLLTNTHFEVLVADDVRFEHCNMVGANWYKGAFHRVQFVDCFMTGFLAGETHFQDVLFKDCKINLAQMRFASFSAVRFEHCDLQESDLLQADCSALAFEECNLQGVEFSGCKLAGIDLSSCNTDGARVGIEELRGATIDLRQALALVRTLGITVKDLGD